MIAARINLVFIFARRETETISVFVIAVRFLCERGLP